LTNRQGRSFDFGRPPTADTHTDIVVLGCGTP
jgi:hypothetical protein